MEGYVIIKNNFNQVESPLSLDEWGKIKDRRDIKRAFTVIEEVREPPEVTELRQGKK